MATAIIFASSLFWRGAWAKILSVDTVDILQFVGEALMRNPILSRCWAGCGYSRLATSRWTKRLKRSELACDERGERGRRPPFNGSDDVPVWLSRMSGASIRRHGCRSPMWQTRLGPAAYFYSAGARHELRSLWWPRPALVTTVLSAGGATRASLAGGFGPRWSTVAFELM